MDALKSTYAKVYIEMRFYVRAHVHQHFTSTFTSTSALHLHLHGLSVLRGQPVPCFTLNKILRMHMRGLAQKETRLFREVLLGSFHCLNAP